MIRLGQLILRHRTRILIGLGGFLVLFTLIGFFVVPPILKSVLATQLTAALHREVTIAEVRVNPFALSAMLRGLAVKEPKGTETFASFEELYLNLGASSLFRWAAVITEVRLTKPFIRVVRRPDQSYNFSDLVPEPQPPPKVPPKPVRFSVNNIQVIDGGAEFSDEAAQKKHSVREVNVGIPFLSNIPSQIETFVQPGLSAVVNGTRYAVQGKTKPFADSLETTLDVNVNDLDLPYYLAYVPPELLTFRMPSGRLDAKLAIVFIRKGNTEQTLAVKGDVGLRDVAVDDTQGGPVVRFPRLGIGLASIEPLVRKVHLSTVSLGSPTFTVRREKTGITNLETLLPKIAPAQKTADPAAAPPGGAVVLDVDEIAVAGATVIVSDLFPRLPFTTTLAPIDVKVTQLSTRPDTKGTYAVTLKTEAKEEIALDGTMSLAPLQVDGKVAVQAVILKKYAPYYSDLVFFDIQSGTLNLSSRYQVSPGDKEPAIVASEAAVSVSALRLQTRDTKQEFLYIPILAVKNTTVDLTQQDVAVGDVSTERGNVVVVRTRDGEINLARLLPRATAAAESLADAPGVARPAVGPGSVRPARPWIVKAGAIAVSRYRIHVTDEVPSEPVKLVVEDLTVRAERLSTVPNSTPGKASLSLRIDQGTVASKGTLDIAPIQADLQVVAKEIDLRPFQPYIADQVKIAITDGRVSTAGRLELSTKEPPGLQAKYTGEITLGKFAAIEKSTAEDILKWESLALTELSVGYNPLFVHAKKVALANFFAHLVIQPDGRLNLQDIAATEGTGKPADSPQPAPAAPEATAPTTPSAPMDIRIEEVTLQAGRVQFQDRTLKPSYSATMTEIAGRVSGLSSLETSLADVELRGQMNNSAPLEITGKINPLKQDLFADIRARFTGMDLSPTTPYAGKYVGYTIAKGKLSFDLKYLIDKRKLSSENKVFVDQFTFGDKVDSPTATSLPVKLGVALLKDRNGEIHLDIPVTGSIDDPQFSVWSIVLQVIGNLLAKAVTSPFALLGAAFGGGEEMQYVEFDAGRAIIPEAGAKKLDLLVTALSEKPGLKLEIAGYVAPDEDREGLKEWLMQRKVKAQKLTDLAKQGKPAVPVDDITVAPEEYEKYLTLAYRAEPFPKPRNFIGMVKSLPVPEMETLMLTNIEVGEEELRQLAAQRANIVKETILKSGKIEAERLFIVEPKGLTPEKKEKVKDSRVDFKIA